MGELFQLATVETELAEDISSELLLVRAENILLRLVIDGKDIAIQQLVQTITRKQTRIRAQRLINKKLANEYKELWEKLRERER